MDAPTRQVYRLLNDMGDDLITNRKAHRDYQILETYEAGIVLVGSEVKSLRAGQGNLTDAFARIENGQAWLYNFDIQPYKQANQFNHEPKAVRRLLLNKQEIRKLFSLVSVKGRSLPALKMYWKNRKLKVLLGVGIGKNVRDKREDLKKAVAKREIDQAIKQARRG
jgi:SsrA-binding protein